MAKGYYRRFDDALRFELAHVRMRWEAKEGRREVPNKAEIPFDVQQMRGLALSGGGIRSASFCMGVVQQLHVAGVIDRLHYMSTVSGGGYTGCSLSWFLSKPGELGFGPRFGTERDNFPFVGGDPAGIRNGASFSEIEKIRKEDETKERGPLPGRQVLDYIRQRSSYLNPGAGFSMISALAIVLRSLIVSLVGYVLLAALLFRGLAASGLDSARPADTGLPFPAEMSWFYAVPILAVAAIVFMSLLYSLFAPNPLATHATYSARRLYQPIAGAVLTIGLASLGLALLLELVQLFTGQARPDPAGAVPASLPILGGIVMVAGAVGGVAMQAVKQAGTRLLLRAAMLVVPPVALLLLVAGIGALGYSLAAAFGDHWVVLLVVTLAFCLYANINLTGLHRFYRDRLMETFLPDYQQIKDDGQAAKSTADAMLLEKICGLDDDGPYHLINAHVVLKNGEKARFRSRRGDSFVLSRLFCGAESTGYIETDRWMKVGRFWPARPVGPMGLPTAMAISGAAANPHTGADGRGVTKGPILSAIMTLLNIRLGYWVPSPRPTKRGWRRRSNFWPPNFLFPGVRQGLLGLSHHERANWLELTDGGHFENTGIYELVRRGVRTIVFADGSTDPDVTLSSFSNVLEKIYIDFNVRVTFDGPGDIDFKKLLKGMGGQDELAKRLNLSAAGFAIGTIHYPDGPSGRLFYIKSTMVENLPTALYSYKASNPLFPSESLADQFFSEQQFEAYRALGFALAQAMMAHVEAEEPAEEHVEAEKPAEEGAISLKQRLGLG